MAFQGPHCYISPSWYESNDAVPTWNYVSVHVDGILEFIEDAKQIQHNLNILVSKYEKADSSYRLEEVDDNFMDRLKRGIVNFTIHINAIEGKAKLSQNHSVQRQELSRKAT